MKADPGVAAALKERYGITDVSLLVCDPWSIHIATPAFPPLHWRDDDGTGIAPRLVQCFLYMRDHPDDNQYAHPIDLLPVVDLNAKCIVDMSMQPGPAPKVPMASVNYHRTRLHSNAYLASVWRAAMPPLDVVQPEGASFAVTGDRFVTWDKWTLRVGFNYREGLVLHDVQYDGRPVLNRASLVEMAVPYADPNPPFERKCAFDVGDYGLGYCADSLELGCDCLGHIHYFDATMANSKGEPYTLNKAICMHEVGPGGSWHSARCCIHHICNPWLLSQVLYRDLASIIPSSVRPWHLEDHGVLWKHVEFRTGHNESRRGRRLAGGLLRTCTRPTYNLTISASSSYTVRCLYVWSCLLKVIHAGIPTSARVLVVKDPGAWCCRPSPPWSTTSTCSTGI